jgi:general secretion pathway protein L
MNQIHQFFSLWGAVLRDSLPLTIQRLFGLGRRFTVIEPNGADWLLRQARGASLTSPEPVALAEIAGRVRRMDGPVVLVLPEELAMRPVLTLPGTARRSLDQVLEVEIERLTPFKASDVAVARKIQSTSDGQIKVELTIVPHARIDAHMAPLRDAGIAIKHVIVDRAHLSLAPELSLVSSTESATNRPGGWVPRLVTTALLMGAVASPFAAQEQRLRDQRAELETLRPEVTAVRRLARDVETLKARQEALRAFAKSRQSMTLLLEEVTRTLPDHTWLLNYRYEGERLTLEGRSSSATSLVEILGASPRLSDVRFQAPVTRDPTSGADRFQLSAAVDPK